MKIEFYSYVTKHKIKNSTYKTVINHLNNNIYGMKLAKDLETKYEMINKLSNEILNIHIEIKNELNEYNYLKYEKEIFGV